MRLIRRLHRGEDGVAMMMVVLVSLIAVFVVVAVSTSARTGSDRAVDAKQRSLGNAPIDAAVAAYQQALSTNDVSEATGFVFTQEALSRHVQSMNTTESGSLTTLLPNSSSVVTGVDMGQVTSSIPSNAQLTVATPFDTTKSVYSFWQMYALRAPTFGVTKGGSVVAYFRGWLANWSGPGSAAKGATKPVYVRVQLRGPAFSDYEILTDGKVRIIGGAVINGHIHSNGTSSSLLNQMWDVTSAITLDNIGGSGYPTCAPGARLSTPPRAAWGGGIAGWLASGCSQDQVDENSKEFISLQRVTQSVQYIRTLCGASAPVSVYCAPVTTDTTPYYVTLSGSGACVNTTGSGYGGCTQVSPGSLGLVVVLDRDVRIKGYAGSTGSTVRVTVIAMSRDAGSSGSFQVQSPSITLDGDVGSPDGSPQSSVGLIAEGDIIANQEPGYACPLTIRAAMIAQSGMLSSLKPWRDPVTLPGAPPLCSSFTMDGSYSGHYGMALISATAGYSSRSYQYNRYLYDNPPPLMARTGDWRIQSYGDADLDCFSGRGSVITLSAGGEC